MPSNNPSTDTDVRLKFLDALKPFVDSLVKAIESEHTKDVVELRNVFLRRLVFSGDIIPSRVPPPVNITEIGGYLNYLQELNHGEMALSTVASALGLAVPLSADEKAAMATPRSEDGALKQKLASTTSWVAVCDSEHTFWRAQAATSYDAAQAVARAHDESVHNGKTTAAVLGL